MVQMARFHNKLIPAAVAQKAPSARHAALTGKRKVSQSGLTLIEVLISAVVLAGFFGSIFELSTACLRYIDASKESVAALEAVQDRAEALRNLAFTDLTSSTYVQTLMGSAANTSEFCKKATETVTIRAYPT